MEQLPLAIWQFWSTLTVIQRPDCIFVRLYENVVLMDSITSVIAAKETRMLTKR